MHFTEEHKQIAKETDLVALISSLGYTVKRIGNLYTTKEMDSIRIYNHKTWNRFSRGKGNGSGGDQIDFLMNVENMSYPEAMVKILEYNNISIDDTNKRITKNSGSFLVERHEEQETERIMVLPEKNDNYHRLYAYLIKTRKLDVNVVNYFVKNNMIYESKDHHNIVFLSKDKDGNVKHAYMRGTCDAKPYKGDVAGNDKTYGFNVVTNSNNITVFEAAIDLMSYMSIWRNDDSNKLALGMLSDQPLETFLIEHENVQSIELLLDNDERGMKYAKELMLKYVGLGYDVKISSKVPGEFKDVNEYCKSLNDDLHVINKKKERCR